MAPQYSIVLINKKYNDYYVKIGEWLSNGIKIFWFGDTDSVATLNSNYSDFAKSFLLNCYAFSLHNCFGEVIDGQDESKILSKVAAVTTSFNYEQYKIEHCYPEEHIMVEASAGTGKTTVMIDRVMYLLHTVSNIKLSDIAMITFTNEATAQMQKRLQETLLTRYRLTRNNKYLHYLEEQANMQISTIDSFSFDLIKKCGVVGGFSQQLKIKSLNYERKELIKDILDKLAISNQSVTSQFGVSYYKTTKLIDSFWNRVAELGLNTNEVLSIVKKKAMSTVKSIGTRAIESDAVRIEHLKHIPEVVNVAKDVAIKGLDVMNEGMQSVKDISKDMLSTYKDCANTALTEASKDCYSAEEKKDFFKIAGDFANKGAEQGERSQDRSIIIISEVKRIVGLLCLPIAIYVGGKYIVYPFFTKNK